MNTKLTEIYRSCRNKEALASQDQFNSANVLLGSEVEKFAELIVRECANVAADHDALDIYEEIREHFGVE